MTELEVDTLEGLLTKYHGMIYSEIWKWHVADCDKEDAYQTIALELLRSHEAIFAKARTVADNPNAWVVASVKLSIRSALYNFSGYAKKSQGGKTNGRKMLDATFPFANLSGDSSDEGSTYTGGHLSRQYVPTSTSVEEDYFTTYGVEHVWDYLNQVSDRQRECLTLRYYNELSLPEIAAKTGLGYKQVETALAHGIKNIRINLGVEYKGKRGKPKGTNPFNKAKATHCKRNHEFTPENTRINSSGSRDCRKCSSLRGKERRRKEKANG